LRYGQYGIVLGGSQKAQSIILRVNLTPPRPHISPSAKLSLTLII
jgi:hypothetical protein